jgi:hypothetical protein
LNQRAPNVAQVGVLSEESAFRLPGFCQRFPSRHTSDPKKQIPPRLPLDGNTAIPLLPYCGGAYGSTRNMFDRIPRSSGLNWPW